MKKTPLKTALSFAQTLTELEQIVNHLEAGDLPLETSLTEFERGVQLAKEGQQRLKQAEQRVEILLTNDAQAPLTPFTPEK